LDLGEWNSMADWVNQKKFRVRNKHPFWQLAKGLNKNIDLPVLEDKLQGKEEGALAGAYLTSTHALRRIFLEVAHGMCPEMWKWMDSGPLYCSKNKPELFEVKFQDWLQHFGLYESWQHEWFKWHVDACRKDGRNSEGGWCFPNDVGHAIEILLPSKLAGKKAREHVRLEMDRVMDLVFGRLQVGDTHLKWFIRYQIMGHAAITIAEDEMKHPSVINKGIVQAYNRLHLGKLRKRTRRR